MSSEKIERTIQIAQKLINHLPTEMDDKLKVLLRRAEKGENTTSEIIDLLFTHDNIRRWMQEQISSQVGPKGALRGFGPLAGKPGSVVANQKWFCPKEGCDETLPVIQEDEDAPVCDIHGTKMIRGDEKKG